MAVNESFELEMAIPGADAELDRYIGRLAAAVPKVMDRLREVTEASLGEWNCRLASLFAEWPEEIRRGIVRHPYFSYWWLKVMEKYKAGEKSVLEEWLHHFSRFLIIPMLKTGAWPDGALTVPVWRHQLRFPGHSRQILLPGTEDVRVLIEKQADELVIKGQTDVWRIKIHELLTVEEPILSPLLSDRRVLSQGLEVDAGEEWVELLFRSVNGKEQASGRSENYLQQIDPIPDVLLANFETACSLIEEVWPELWQELLTYTQVIVPYESNFSSTFTEASFMGAVFMAESRQPFADDLYTAEHLLHEHSHLRLTLVLDVDQMFVPLQADSLHQSPFRRDPRPLSGIFHGAFVFARIAKFLAKGLCIGKEERYRKRLAEVLNDLEAALLTLEQNASFTERGQHLMEEMNRLLHAYRTEFHCEPTLK